MALAPALAWAAGWTLAGRDHVWSFPRDHWAHREYKTEWWYFTGHLQSTGEPSRRFGYQFTLFRVGILSEKPALQSAWATRDLVLGHAAIGDLGASRHRFSEVLYREMPLLGGFGAFPQPRIAWSRAPAGTDGGWNLRWNGAGFDLAMRDDAQGLAFGLTTTPIKPLALQGPNGYSRKSATGAAASLYYSFTRLRTAGWIRSGGRRLEVAGTSWMDHEFGSSQLGARQVGWDWFSLQLDDGRDLMLYTLRRSDGSTDFARGTLITADGRTRYFGAEAWRLRADDHWFSPQSAIRYPARWRLELPADRLSCVIVPELAEQENRGRLAGGITYWEGAVRVEDGGGSPIGRGYVELTGYGAGNRPPI
jgi:predicted secreted hydrolase